MRENKKAIQGLIAILSAISLLLVFICVYLLSAFREELHMYQYHLRDIEEQLLAIQEDLSAFNDNDEETSKVVESISFSFGAFDPEAAVIPIIVTIEPNPSLASKNAILLCNGDEIVMTKINQGFRAEIPGSIAETYAISSVTFLENGQEETQELDREIEPIRQFIPKLASVFEGHMKTEKEFIRYSGTLTFDIYDFPLQSAKMKEANLIEILDGVEQNSKKINIPLLPVFGPRFSSSSTIKGSIPFGSKLEFVLELVDEYEFRYHYVAQHLEAEEGSVHRFYSTQQIKVYDPRGLILYSGQHNIQ